MKNERILAQGISVSNDTRATGLNNNDLIIGSAGSGKTGGYVIPNLQNIEGSMIVSDTKGQLVKLFKDDLIKRGYEVHTLDLVEPERSCAYNPLAHIRREKNGRYREQDVLTLATLLSPVRSLDDPFWDTAAMAQIAFYIAYSLDALEPEEQNLASLCRIHGMYCQPGGKNLFLKWALQNPNTYAAKKFMQINAVNGAEKTSSCINEFVTLALDPFNFREAETIFGDSDSIDLADLGREKTVLFLNVSDTDTAFDKVVNIIYAQALHVLCAEADSRNEGRLEVPVRIIMDDFAASARIPGFDKIISVIRSRDISVSLVLQSLTQLETMYSRPTALTIVNNCDHIVYLGCQDLDTATFLAHHIGKAPEAVLSLPLSDALIITKGEKARQAKKIVPYSTMPKRNKKPAKTA